MDNQLCFGDLCKDGWVLHGDFGENLAVETDLFCLEAADQFAKGEAELASSGVDARLLEAAVVALFEFATHVGVETGFCCGNFRERDFGFASPHHALGSGENILSAFDAVCSAFDSWHMVRSAI